MGRMYSNPNNRFRTISPGAHLRLKGPVITGKEMEKVRAAEARALRERERLERKGDRFMKSVIRAAKLIIKSKDKRRRPRSVSKEAFKMARKLKLTRTTKIKRKVP